MLKLAEGEILVKLARSAIETHVKTGRKPEKPQVSGELNEPRGVFVTITKDGNLRGCIGHPVPTMPLVDAVMDAAVSAAVHDPRFNPVSVDELPRLIVEVSVLTLPEEIKVNNPKEYLERIKVGRHGLIVERSINRGLLLPQVPVEWNWNVEEFLSQACNKAGLPADCWLDSLTKISSFEAQIFAEKNPSGQIEERPL